MILLLLACAPALPESVADFLLVDVNERSARHGQEVGPPVAKAEGMASVWFFGHASCPYCAAQFEVLDQLQRELNDAGYPVLIAGINEVGQEEYNTFITAAVSLPWLQDTVDVDAWGAWAVEWRDLFVLDLGGAPTLRINLTDHDLQDPAELDALRAAVELAATTG